MSTPLPHVSIVGLGHHLPTTIEDNESLCRSLAVTPQWIEEKTGIRQRRIAEPHETVWSYAVKAGEKALAMAGIDGSQLDLIVCCTFSGDYIFPPLAAKVQQQLAAKKAQIYDLQANCAGFVTGLTTASDRMRVDPDVRYALVIGAEFCTRHIDRSDVNTAIFLSDGAGAAVLAHVERGGIMASAFHTDSANYDSVRLRGGGASFPNNGRPFDREIDLMEMNGIATWKQAITHLPPTIRRAVTKAGLALADIDFLVFHQANLRLIEYLVRKLGFGMDKTFTNVAEVGNTGSASLAIALSDAFGRGLLDAGQLVVLAGVGAGFNFAASTWTWTLERPS